MKKIVKLVLALTLILTIIPTNSWNAFAIDNKANVENNMETPDESETSDVEATVEPTPEVIAEATPEVTVEPTPEVTVEPTPVATEETTEPTETPEVTEDTEVQKTTLLTVHNYIENDRNVTKEVVIENLSVGDSVNALDYAMNLENQPLFKVDNETLILSDVNNVIVYQYGLLKESNINFVNNVYKVNSKKARSAFGGNNEPGAVFPTKNAEWVDEDKGIAKIQFTVKGNQIQTGADIVLVIDDSHSMIVNDRWEAMKNAVIAFSEEIYQSSNGVPSDNRLAIVSFGHNAKTLSGFAGVNDLIDSNPFDANDHKVGAREFYSNYLWNLTAPLGFSTQYDEGFRAAKEIIDQKDGTRPSYVVFLSDGLPSTGYEGVNSFYNALEIANNLKANNVSIYSLGLQLNDSDVLPDVTLGSPFEKVISPLASDPKSQYAKNIKNTEDLTPIYKELGGEIKIAGTNAIITDYINDDLFEITTKPNGSVSYEASHGSVTIEGNKVSWDVGSIATSEKTLTIYVKVKSDATATGLVYTNKKADLSYIDYNGQTQNKDIPNASLTIGDTGTIRINTYLVNAQGETIAQDGSIIEDFSKRVVLGEELYKQGGKAALPYNTYEINPSDVIEIQGKTYTLVEVPNGSAIPSKVTINAANKYEDLYFGYQEVSYKFSVEHYFENENGEFILQEPADLNEIPYEKNKTIYASEFVKEDIGYTYDEKNSNAINAINTDQNGTTLKLYYNRVMEKQSYYVYHIFPDGIDTVQETVDEYLWVAGDQKLTVTAESIADKKVLGYKIESVKLRTQDIVAGDKVNGQAGIKVTYVKDESQTKEISYTVEHVLPNGSREKEVIKETVWVNAPETLTVTNESIATKAPAGYVVDQVLSGETVINAGDTVNNGTNIKVTYKENKEDVVSLSYMVNHVFPDGIATVQETVYEDVWAAGEQKLTVTAESIADKKVLGYKVESVKLRNQDIVAGDKVNGQAVITVTYVKDESQTKEISYTVEHVLPNGSSEKEVIKETVWVNAPETLTVTNESIATKAPAGYVVDQVLSGETVINAGDTVNNGTNIKVTYKENKEDVVSLSYTVNHVFPDGIDTIQETVYEDVWVAGEQKLTVTAESIADKKVLGYKVESVKLRNQDIVAGDKVNGQAVITVTYVKDESQTKEISYTVEHEVDGIHQSSDDVIVKETVWVKAPNNLKVTSDSLAQNNYKGHEFVGYKIKGTETSVQANDEVLNGTVIVAVYQKMTYEYTVNHYTIDALGNVVLDVNADDTHETHEALYLDQINALDHKATIENHVFWYAEKDLITLDTTGNVLDLYYYEDKVGAVDLEGNDVGDLIPDVYQVKFTYQVETAGSGFVTLDGKTSTYEYVTKPYDVNANYDASILSLSVNPTASNIVTNVGAGYSFSRWYDESYLSYSTVEGIREAQFSVATVFTVSYSRIIAPPVDPTPTPTPSPLPTPTPTTRPTVEPTPTETPEVEVDEVVVDEEDTPEQGGADSETIDEEETPEFNKKGSWALINLIAALSGLLMAIILLFAKKKSEEEKNEESKMLNAEDETPEEYQRKRIYKLVSALVAIISIVVFVLTENMRLPMVLIDKYTLIMIVLALVNLGCLYLGKRWNKVETEKKANQ